MAEGPESEESGYEGQCVWQGEPDEVAAELAELELCQKPGFFKKAGLLCLPAPDVFR